MQARRSADLQSPYLNGGTRGGREEGRGLMHDYDVENQFELGDLADDGPESAKRTSFDEEQRSHRLSGAGRGRVQKESVQPKRNSLLR